MNENDLNTGPQAWTDPALEARVVAAVLGETSAFEAAELDRLLAENPELAIFKRRIEAVHALAGAAVRLDEPKLSLSPDRRRILLETIGAKPSVPPQNVSALNRQRPSWLSAHFLIRLAACLAVAAIIVSFVADGLIKRTTIVAEGKISFAGMAQTAAAPAASGSSDYSSSILPRSGPAATAASSECQPTGETFADAPATEAAFPPTAAKPAPQAAPESTFALNGDNAYNGGTTVTAGDLGVDQKGVKIAGAAKFKTRESEFCGKPTVVSAADQNGPHRAVPSGIEVANAFHSGSVTRTGSGGGGAGGRISTTSSLSGIAPNEEVSASRGKGGAASPASPASDELYASSKEMNTRADDRLRKFDLATSRSSTPPADPGPQITNNVTAPSTPVASAGRMSTDDALFQRQVATPGWGELAKDEKADGGKVEGSATDQRSTRSEEGSAEETTTGGETGKLAFYGSMEAGGFARAARDRDEVHEALDKSKIAGNSLAPDSSSATSIRGRQTLAGSKNLAPAGKTEEPAKAIDGLVFTEGKKRLEPVPVLGDITVLGRLPASAVGKDHSPAHQTEIQTAKQPFSTFSLHVSDVSFQLAKDALAKGTMPDPDRIRPEEFYNAFDYGDPSPAAGEEVACKIEQCAHPFLQQRNLVRVALKVAAAGRNASQPLCLTVLLDTSGSMEREDRAALVRQALQTLATLLGPNDRITLIGFARTPRLLAEQVPGDQAGKLAGIAASTPSEGGTNLELALALASEMAFKQHVPAAQNRIVLLTDGAANLGNANPDRLARQIEKTRQQGISFDACGVGANGLNDEILEALTRKGDGRYYFLNKPGDADAGFARQLAGAFRPAAENVKVQVRFNPSRVKQYRLIGFEKHLLRKEDFHNDKVGAAELSAEEAGVAVYQVEPLPEGEGELGEVSVRFRDPANGRMVERSWTMPYDAKAPVFDRAAPPMQLAATAALLAEYLRGNAETDLNSLPPSTTALRGYYPNQARVTDLIQMMERLKK